VLFALQSYGAKGAEASRLLHRMSAHALVCTCLLAVLRMHKILLRCRIHTLRIQRSCNVLTLSNSTPRIDKLCLVSAGVRNRQHAATMCGLMRCLTAAALIPRRLPSPLSSVEVVASQAEVVEQLDGSNEVVIGEATQRVMLLVAHDGIRVLAALPAPRHAAVLPFIQLEGIERRIVRHTRVCRNRAHTHNTTWVRARAVMASAGCLARALPYVPVSLLADR
jgi:hypothetical protein